MNWKFWRRSPEDIIIKKDEIIARKDKMISDKDAIIVERDQALIDKDRIIAEKEQKIIERMDDLKKLQSTITEKEEEIKSLERKVGKQVYQTFESFRLALRETAGVKEYIGKDYCAVILDNVKIKVKENTEYDIDELSKKERENGEI